MNPFIPAFKPMLAGKAPDDLSTLFPERYLMSPKLDGIRCVMIDGVPHSRNLKPIPNLYVRARLSGLPCFDGELIVGQPVGADVMNRTASGVMAVKGEPDFTYHVFDKWDEPSTRYFSERLAKASELAANYRLHRLAIVKHVVASEPEHVQAFAELRVKWGYEGAMIRLATGSYKHGRSTVKERGLLKIKFFDDAEAIATGATEQMHNANEQTRDELGRSKRSKRKDGLVSTGKLGNIVCEFRGKRFEIGTGFDDAQRHHYWLRRDALPGSLVKFKYQGLTPDGVPRFPVFLGFRNPADLSA